VDPTDDARLDAVLRQAAPERVPESLAGRVLAMARARRRRGRFARLAAAAAAALAVAAGARLWPWRPAQPPRGLALKADPPAPAMAEAPGLSPTGSFAAVLPARGDSTHSVMMARFNGRLVVCARPKAAEGHGPGPAPRVMVGWLSLD
jgi:hypothetical protein